MLGHRYRLRHEQRLAHQAAIVIATLQLFVNDTFMGGVHVDDHETVAILRQDIGAGDLSNGITERRRFRRARLGARNCGAARQRAIAGHRLAHGCCGWALVQGHRPLPDRRIASHRYRRYFVAAGSRVAKRELDRLRDHAVHSPPVAKTNLVLGGVRVGVDAGRVHRQAKHVGREAAVEKDVAVGVARSVRERLVRHAASVDEPVLQVRLAAVERGQSDPAGQCDAVSLAFEVDRLLGEGIPAQAGNTLAALILGACCRKVNDLAPVVGQGESDIGA